VKISLFLIEPILIFILKSHPPFSVSHTESNAMNRHLIGTFAATKNTFEKYIFRKFCIALAVSAILGISYMAITPRTQTIHQMPTGSIVSAGEAVIVQNGNEITIHQTSQRAVINWSTFNLSEDVKVNLIQPNGGATLIRVNDDNPTRIDGVINSNAKVVFVNPNGFVFGKSARITAGAFNFQLQ